MVEEECMDRELGIRLQRGMGGGRSRLGRGGVGGFEDGGPGQATNCLGTGMRLIGKTVGARLFIVA